MNDLIQNDPSLLLRLQNSERILDQWLSDHPDWKNADANTSTIPVVVHIVYNTTVQNISNAQVFSQIDVLNEDYSRTNPDTNLTPVPFRAVAAATPYQFCLAQRDPSGAPTNGIERRQTSVTSFNTNDDIKHYSTGGLDAWDPNRYFNIWVGYLGPFLLGYGEFPTSMVSNTFGVVIAYDAFGRTGTVTSPFDLGRTASHEIGHCMNLYHIWGDDNGACTGSDSCADTPNQADATSGCYTFPHTDACTPTGNGIMFMNYMDYSDDNCVNMFTEDQVARMVAAMNSFYPSLLSSDGCVPPTQLVNDAGALHILSPGGSSCDLVISPVVTIKNWGSANLTSATINYKVDAGTLNTYNWTGNLASLDTESVSLPLLGVSSGSHNFVAYTSNPNGTTDLNTSNDTTSRSFTISSGTGQALPTTQGFESVFPPAGYSLINPDLSDTWEANGTVSHSGSKCAYVGNYYYNAAGERDHLVLPAVDLTSLSNPELSFWLAYAHYDGSLGLLTDSLQIDISFNCGMNWTTLFYDGGASLNTTASGLGITSEFIPVATDWKRFAINLAPYATHTSAEIRFTNINGYGNDLYLDDINIDIATGIQAAPATDGVTVYPNPARDAVRIGLKTLEGTHVRIRLLTAVGRELEIYDAPLPLSYMDIPVNTLPSGLYFLEILHASGKTVKQLLIAR